MQLLSKAWLGGTLIRLMIMVIVIKALMLGLLWFLPAEGVSAVKHESAQPAYARYTINNMLQAPKASAVSTTTTGGSGYGVSIANLILKGIYGTATKGYAIVAMKKQPAKTEVVAVSETYEGYTLTSIEPYMAHFERNGQAYTLKLEVPKYEHASVQVHAADDEPVINRQVSRYDIQSYTKDIDRIWKEISIKEVKTGNQITGFRVMRLDMASPLAGLGLQKGDIIVKANNKALNSYAAALDVYKTIETIDTLVLTIMRNNQEKEIIYEVN